MIRAKPQVTDRTAKALAKIKGISDRVVGECTADAVKMTQALMRDGMKAPTGRLEASVRSERVGPMDYILTTDAENEQGMGYGAAQEWGWTGRGGVKVKGRHYILRGFWGMIKRYQRGEKWRD
jgi:hypothetical protein